MVSSEAGEVPQRFSRQYVRILETLARSEGLDRIAGEVLREAAQASGCESAALRVRTCLGEYSCFASRGPAGDGAPGPDAPAAGRSGCSGPGCICELVASGRTDPRQPGFTPAGGFWTGALSELLVDGALPGGAVRGGCIPAGQESVGLFPLRCRGEVAGILQVGSRQGGRIGPEAAALLEAVAPALGGAAQAVRWREELARLRREFDEQRRGAVNRLAVSEMTSSLAHEVKNPLASMMLSANRIGRLVRGDEKLAPLAEHLCAAIKTLGETVTRLTDRFAPPALEPAPLAVNEVLKGALCLVAPRAADQGVRVVPDLAAGLSEVSADAGLLRQVFLSLLANALEAMPSGGQLRVTTRSGAGGDVVAVIADSGPGAPAEAAERLFRPLANGQDSGSGLGLGIVRRIMELHRGSAHLEPGPSGGTEAIVKLPAAVPGAAR